MLSSDIPTLDPIQILNLFKKSYQKIQPNDLNLEWESYNIPEKPKFVLSLPEFKKGRSEPYSKSFFKELDKLIKAKKDNIRFFSSLFKEHLYIIFEDPPKFDESDQLVDVCLTLIQTFCILADTPSTDLLELNKFYENAQIFIYIFTLKCDCYEAQRIKNEKLANEYNAKQFSLSQKNITSPKKANASGSKLGQRTNSLSNSKQQVDDTAKSKFSASTSSTEKNKAKSESINSKPSESTSFKSSTSTNSKTNSTASNSKTQTSSLPTSKTQLSSTISKPYSTSSSTNPNAQSPSPSLTKSTNLSPKSSSVSIDQKTQSSSTKSTNSKSISASIEPKAQSTATNLYPKLSSVSIDPKTQSSSTKSTNLYSKSSSVSINPKTQSSTNSTSNYKSTTTTSTTKTSSNSKLQSQPSSSRLPSSRPDSRSSMSRPSSAKNMSGSQSHQSSNKLTPDIANDLKFQISLIIDCVKKNPKYKQNWDTIQSDFKAVSEKVHLYIKGQELENYCKKFNSNVIMTTHSKERLELLISCLKGIDSLIQC